MWRTCKVQVGFCSSPPMVKFLRPLCGLVVPATLLAQAPVETPPVQSSADTSVLKEVQILSPDDLRSVTGIDISADGKFLYAAAFNSSNVTAFTRDTAAGTLTVLESTTGPNMQSAVSVRLSKDGTLATASAFGSNAVTLFQRNTEDGKLTILDSARHTQGEDDGLNFAIDARVSPDNRYLYTASSDGVGVYKIEGGKLSFVESQSAGGQIAGLRGAVLSPDSKYLYAPGASSGSVGVFTRDEASGKLSVLQVLKDGADGLNTLEGAFRIACSPDGKHVYLSSGRFGGDQAITAFSVSADGKLQLTEAHVNGSGAFDGFEGGNDIKVSNDGKYVYAVASLSDRLVRFQRNPESGKLTFLGSQPVGHHATPGAAGLAFSPDDRFLYVADEDANEVVVYQQP